MSIKTTEILKRLTFNKSIPKFIYWQIKAKIKKDKTKVNLKIV